MSKANPGKIDYNKDRVVDSADDVLAVQDRDKDGVVTSKEKAKYQQDQAATTTEYTYDAKGNITSQTTKGAGKPVPEPTLSASELGYSEAFLKTHPQVSKALDLAIKYNWTEEQFVRYVESETDFGKSTTDAQALFDIESVGTKAEEWQKKVDDRAAQLKQQAIAAGVQVTDEEIAKFARDSVRSGLTDQDTLAFLSKKFVMPGLEEQGQAKAATPAGQAAQMVDEIKSMARSYGITVTDQFIQDKVREGMAQGSGWQTWLEGQRNTFRQQAKLLYPTVADKFDQFTLGDILQPYLNDASELLGINIQQMNYDDPMWTTALNGPNGVMNRDEWLRTLRTDKKYGYDSTVRARQEYVALADDLLAAFGMA